MTDFGNRSDSITIKGGSPLWGRLKVQGSKNSSLPILAATLLIPGTCTITNVPNITDVYYMRKLLEHIGCKIIIIDEHTLQIDATNLKEYLLPGAYVKKMRSSVVLLGPLLARLKQAGIDYPGGCVIGERPIDLHLEALKRLGANLQIDGHYIRAMVSELIGNEVVFPFKSVGATQNTILLGVTAKGKTVIKNASIEPEIQTLCDFLNKAGANIKIQAPDMITIEGVDELKPIEYKVVSDRIVAGTYLFATMAAKGEILLEDAPIEYMESVLDIARQMGSNIEIYDNKRQIHLKSEQKMTNLSYIETKEYPGFPTDMQSQLMAVSCISNGKLELKENIFSNRYNIVDELRRMGADIQVNGNQATVRGVNQLEGRHVIAIDLRAGAGLVIAGLAASDVTVVSNAHFIDRGYEDIVRDLTRLNASINR